MATKLSAADQKRIATVDMIDLVNERVELQEALRQRKFDTARTNVEKLMAAGVIISCDDAYENAMIAQGRAALAKEVGVSEALVHAAFEFALIADSIITEWKYTADCWESPDEHSARVRATSLEGEQPIAKGKKKPCQHNSTRKERGLWLIRYGETEEEWACCRCGKHFRVTRRPEKPTHAAQVAALLYARFGNEPTGESDQVTEPTVH